jgi:glycosyltransferase involved in cell wall biosynthesis
VNLPRVSICIPTYSRLHYLREAVASARAQTVGDIEILIGDDGDSVELRDWCLAQAAADPRLRYHKTPQRLRLAGNWNFLSDLARGEFVTLMGDDDRLLPTFCERLLEAAAAHPPANVVFSHQYVIDGDGTRSVEQSEAFTRQYGRGALARGPIPNAAQLVWANSVPLSSSMVRTTDVRRLRFKPDLNSPELELFVRLVTEDARFLFVDEYLSEYRLHAGSETSSGLTIDRLANYLQHVAAASDAEPVKRRTLRTMVPSGVGIRLKAGDVPGARALFASDYYPRDATDPRILAQRLVLAMPDRLAAPAHRLARRVDQSIKKLRKLRGGQP